jgi:hypothetical protein
MKPVKNPLTKKEISDYRKRSKTALRTFMKFLSKQDKIKTSNDLLPELHYSHISGDLGFVYRCILRRGYEKVSLINVEIDSADRGIVAFIYSQMDGKNLCNISTWKEER